MFDLTETNIHTFFISGEDSKKSTKACTLRLRMSLVIATELYVEEMYMFSNKELIIGIRVSDPSRPLKATIAWIDPSQPSVAHKILLHDIDLRIEMADGSNTTWHGNKIPGDELNTVEQVLIESPSTSLDYYVHVTSKILTNFLYQKISLVITGAGLSQVSRVEGDAPPRYSLNEIECKDDEMMLTAKLMDRGADGWNSGDFFMITNEAAQVISTKTMGEAIPDDFLKREFYCLPAGKYELTLLTLGEDYKETSVTMDECTAYLAGILPAHHSAEIDVVADGTGGFTCNECSGAHIPLLLVGSLYGVPYGWAEGVTYRVFDSSDAVIFEGTLGTGNFEERHLCLADGDYSLYFNIPSDADDDLFDSDDYYASIYGIEEYLMQLNGKYTIDIASAMTFTISSGVMTNDTTIFDVDIPEDGEDDDAIAEVVIIIIVSIVVGVCLICFVLCAMGVLYCGQEKPLTREEVEARYRADIAELMKVENPLHAGNAGGEKVEEVKPRVGLAKRISQRLSKRFSARLPKRFSNFDTPDWKAKVENSSREASPNDEL